MNDGERRTVDGRRGTEDGRRKSAERDLVVPRLPSSVHGQRIGIDGGTWGNARGYGRFTRELVRALACVDERNRYCIFLDAQTPRNHVPSNLLIVPVATSQSPSRAASADGYRSPRDMLAFSRAIARAPLDVIFFPSVYTFVPVLRRMSVVVGVHDVIAERFPQFVFQSARAKLFWNIKTRLAVRQATRVLTVSEHARQGVQEHFHLAPDKLRVTHEAAAAAFRPITDRHAIDAMLARVGLAPDARYVIYFGGLTPHKNVQMLVYVFADVIREPAFADVKLVLAGDFQRDVYLSAYSQLRAQVNVNCPMAVIFTGHVDDDEAALLLNGALVSVLPSLDEGFGLPGIEAAACGTPLIATRHSAMPAVLGDAALYIDPSGPTELRTALVRVLEDEALRHTMGERGLERVRQLTWESAARRVIDVFEEL